jgi:hypothetical protein
LRTDRYLLRIARITYRRKVLREPLCLIHDRRRLQPAYAVAFREMLVAYAESVFPVTKPIEPKR